MVAIYYLVPKTGSFWPEGWKSVLSEFRRKLRAELTDFFNDFRSLKCTVRAADVSASGEVDPKQPS